MRKTTSGYRCHLYEHLQALPGPNDKAMGYANREFYFVEGLPGLWRKVVNPRVSEPQARGILMAWFDGGQVYLKFAEEPCGELEQGGFGQEIEHLMVEEIDFVNKLRAAAKQAAQEQPQLPGMAPSAPGSPETRDIVSQAILPTPDPAPTSHAPIANAEVSANGPFVGEIEGTGETVAKMLTEVFTPVPHHSKTVVTDLPGVPPATLSFPNSPTHRMAAGLGSQSGYDHRKVTPKPESPASETSDGVDVQM